MLLGIILVIILAVLAFGAAVTLRLAVLPEGEEVTAPVAALVTSLMLGLIIIAVVWFLAMRLRGGSLSSLGLTRPRVPGMRASLLTLGVIVASLGATATYSLLVQNFGPDILMPPDQGDIVFPGAAALLTFIVLALWTPLTEEIFFRGFIFPGLKANWGAPRAILISGAIFSGFHLFLGVLIPVFITGVLFAWLYHRTGSLWSAVIAHAVQNGLVVFATVYGT